MGETILEIKNLIVDYKSERGRARAVNKVNIKIDKGEIFGLVGESGSGKSTLGKSIIKLLPWSASIPEGEIIFKGKNILSLSEREINKNIRGKEITMVLQNPQNTLNPVFTVGRQILDVLYFKSNKKTVRNKLKPKAIEILKKMGISDPEYRFNEYPHQFSGGMKQRVMIAMAFISNPSLLLADEPTTALDVTVEAQILNLLKGLVKEYGTSILYITHDLGVVSEITDKIAVMYAGNIVEIAKTRDLFNNPLHPYTIGLLDCMPGKEAREFLATIPGRVPDFTDLPSGCNFCPRCSRKIKKCEVEIPELIEVKPEHYVACFQLSKGGN
jgi:oligopeptide/dipeptide ABC transporter ATP-binding protein